jgi:hypothetical protein
MGKKETKKETEAQLTLLKEVLAEKGRIAKLNSEQLANLSQTINLMKDDLVYSKQRVKDAQDSLKLKMKDKDATKFQIELLKEQVTKEKDIHNLLKGQSKLRGKLAKQEADITAEIRKKQADFSAAHEKGLEAGKKRLKGLQNEHEALKNIDKTASGAFSLTKGLASTILGLGSESIKLSEELLTKFGPEAILAKYLGFDISFKHIQDGIADLPKQLDTAFTGMVAATAMPIETLGNSLAAALDPTGAEEGIEGYKEALQKLNLTKADQPLIDVGFKTEEVKESLGALIDNAALFRTEFMKTEPVLTALTTNLITGLKKVGVNTKTSAKIFDVFTKSMKKTPLEANKSLLKVSNIADSLGISMGKAFGNFETAMPTLSQFGSRMTEVFAELQARSAATGTEMSKLVGIAMKMDTFEGAAKAAQTLNGVLGGTLISVTDLVHADPGEKFDIISDAINNSGVEFDSLNRRYKKIIATAAGFEDVAEFQRQLYGGDAVKEAKDALDTSAMSTETLAAKTKQTLNMQEKAKASVSSFAVAAKKAYETSKIAAEVYSASVKKAYTNTLKLTKNQESAFIAAKELIGLNAILETKAEAGAEAITGVVRGAAAVGVGAGVVIKALTGGGGADAGEAVRAQQDAANTQQRQVAAADTGEGSSVEFNKAVLLTIDPEAGQGLIQLTGRVVNEKNRDLANAALSQAI